MRKSFKTVWFFMFLCCALSLNANDTFTLLGKVDLNNTYDLDVLLDRMENEDIQSVKEYSDLFLSLRKSLPRIKYDKVTVYLSGNGKTRKTRLTNQYCTFQFEQLPKGEYTITVEAPFESSRKNFFLKKLSASTVVMTSHYYSFNPYTTLFLDMEGVTLKGRLIDPYGNPVAGGKIIVRNPERTRILMAVSNQNGDFELSGIPPVSFFFVSNYLSCENVCLRSLRKEIEITADGYLVPEKYRNMEMLMITEDMVARARRFIAINQKKLKRMGTPKEIKIQNRTFPPSKGNTIYLGDIVLKRK